LLNVYTIDIALRQHACLIAGYGETQWQTAWGLQQACGSC